MERVEREGGVKVRWVPWEGRPEGVDFLERTPEEAEELLAKQNSMAARYDLQLNFPWKKCRTRLAHQATLFARDHGRMDAFRDAVFEARFRQDLDIGDTEVLVSLGEQVGLEGSSMREALKTKAHAADLDELRRQGETAGVTGIPTYIVDGNPYWGADPTDEVLGALQDRISG